MRPSPGSARARSPDRPRRPPCARPSRGTPRPRATVRASSSLLPTTSGTTPCAGPLETSSVTVGPCSACEFPDGVWRMTRSTLTVSSATRFSSHLEARVGQRAPRGTPAVADDVRDLLQPRPVGDVERHGRALVDRRPAGRRLADDGVARLVGVVAHVARPRSPRLRRRCVATEIELPTTLGTFTRLGATAMTIAMIAATPSRPASTTHGQRLDRARAPARAGPR